MADKIDPALFGLLSNVGKELKTLDFNTTDKGSSGNAFKLDLRKAIPSPSGGHMPPMVDPTLNMPDPAGNLGYEEFNVPLPTVPPLRPVPNVPAPAEVKSNEPQLGFSFGQSTINDIYDKLDSIENLLTKAVKMISSKDEN